MLSCICIRESQKHTEENTVLGLYQGWHSFLYFPSSSTSFPLCIDREAMIQRPLKLMAILISLKSHCF